MTSGGNNRNRPEVDVAVLVGDVLVVQVSPRAVMGDAAARSVELGSVGFMRERLLEERIVDREKGPAAEVRCKEEEPDTDEPAGMAMSIQCIGEGPRRAGSGTGWTRHDRSTSRMHRMKIGEPREQPRCASSGRARAAARRQREVAEHEQRSRRTLPAAIQRTYHGISSGRLPDQMIRNCENEKYADSITKASNNFPRS